MSNPDHVCGRGNSGTGQQGKDGGSQIGGREEGGGGGRKLPVLSCTAGG